jgi:hypothetical protein
MLNKPPSSPAGNWYTQPKFLMLGGVGVVVIFLLMRNKGSSQTAPVASTTTNPVGGSYSYLDGSGIQHIIATDPQGNLTSYASVPPDTTQPTGQLLGYGSLRVPGWNYSSAPDGPPAGWTGT